MFHFVTGHSDHPGVLREEEQEDDHEAGGCLRGIGGGIEHEYDIFPAHIKLRASPRSTKERGVEALSPRHMSRSPDREALPRDAASAPFGERRSAETASSRGPGERGTSENLPDNTTLKERIRRGSSFVIGSEPKPAPAAVARRTGKPEADRRRRGSPSPRSREVGGVDHLNEEQKTRVAIFSPCRELAIRPRAFLVTTRGGRGRIRRTRGPLTIDSICSC